MSDTNASLPDAVPADVQIMDMSFTNLVIARILYIITKLGIPDLLRDGPCKSEDLARATESHPRMLYRLLRAAGNAGLLSESQDHAFSLTPLADLLRADVPGSMRSLVIYCGDSYYIQGFDALPDSIQTGKSSFEEVHGMGLFEYFKRHPEAGINFDQAMTEMSQMETPPVVKAFDLSPFKTLIDVGGGHGFTLKAILEANPHLHGILFDQPQVIDEARKRIDAAGLLSRCDLVTGDFFHSVPEGGDAYIMKSIIHDWDDEPSVRILKNCRRAMTDKAHLFLLEEVVPPPGEPHFSKYMDLEMLVINGGQERTIEEFTALFVQAGLKLCSVTPTEGLQSIIEAVPA